MLRPALSEAAWKGGLEVHDFLVQEGRRALAVALQEEGLNGAPPEVARVMDPASYFLAVPQRRVVLVGHPPRQQIQEALTLPGLPARLLLSQEEMHGPGIKYEVWDFQKGIANFPLSTPLPEALRKGGMLPAATGAP